MYFVRKHNGERDIYVTVEPVSDMADNSQYPVCFAWAYAKAEAVRFATRWHAQAIADAIPGKGTVEEDE